MAATETTQGDEECSNDIAVEWERQLELRRSKRSNLYFLRMLEPSCDDVEFDPLVVTLLDDDSSFRIGAFLTTETCPVTSMSLKIRAESLSERAAQVFSNSLRLSHVVDLELNLDGNEDNTSSDTTLPESWQIILDGAIDTVHELDIRVGLGDALADRIGTRLVGNSSLQKFSIRLETTMTEYGAQRLADGFHQAQIQQLVLMSYKSFAHSKCRAMEILVAQAVLANVHELFLPDVLENDEAVALGEALVGNTSLSTLSVKLGEYLNRESALVLANGLRQSHISRLEVPGDDDKSWNYFAEDIICTHGIQYSQTIQHLYLGTGLSMTESDAFAQCLPRLASLEISLDTSTGYFFNEYQNIEPFFDDLRFATRLTTLEISLCLQAQELVHLCSVLPFLSSLTQLKVHGNLTSESGDELINDPPYEVDENDNVIPMKYSELARRNVEGRAAAGLMIVAATHPCLEHLDLSHSTDIGFLGIAMIGFILPFVRLRELNLSGVGDSFASDEYDDDKDVQAFQAKAYQLLLDGVRSNPNLHALSLEYGHVPETVVEPINFQLDMNKFGSFLSDEELVCGVWSHILAKCQDKASIMFHLLREQILIGAPTAAK